MTKITASINIVVKVSFKDDRKSELQDQAYEAMREHISPSHDGSFDILSSDRPYIDMVGGVQVKKGDKINT